jgi:hypothetical protein
MYFLPCRAQVGDAMLQLNKSILETVIPSGAKAHADFAAFAARDPEGTPVMP